MALRFEELPSTRGRNKRFAEDAAVLREHPNEWAIIVVETSPARASAVASSIRNGEYAALPKGEFEAAARTVSTQHRRESRVYVRYVAPST